MFSYVYIYINLEEGPPFGGEDRAHIFVRLAPILIDLNKRQCFHEEVLFFLFCKFGSHTRWENHKWYVSIGRR